MQISFAEKEMFNVRSLSGGDTGFKTSYLTAILRTY